jgi:hypothetical protein
MKLLSTKCDVTVAVEVHSFFCTNMTAENALAGVADLHSMLVHTCLGSDEVGANCLTISESPSCTGIGQVKDSVDTRNEKYNAGQHS